MYLDQLGLIFGMPVLAIRQRAKHKNSAGSAVSVDELAAYLNFRHFRFAFA